MSDFKINNQVEFNKFCNKLESNHKITMDECSALKNFVSELYYKTMVLPCKIGEPCIVLSPCYCYDMNIPEKCANTQHSTIKYIARVKINEKPSNPYIPNNKYYGNKGKIKCLKMYERPFKIEYLNKIGQSVFVGESARQDAIKVLESLGEVLYVRKSI